MQHKSNKLNGIFGFALLTLLAFAMVFTQFAFGRYVYTGTGFVLSSKITGEIVRSEVKVTGISVKPKKNVYDIGKGETFSSSDLTVTAIYSNGVAADVTDFTVDFGADSDFSTFGQKTGVVSYTFDGDTVTSQVIVYAVNTNELALSGVEGAQIERYFEQFGINAVGQKFYAVPGEATQDPSVDPEAVQTLTFSTGTVEYQAKLHQGMAVPEETDTSGQLTINCTAAPFADIFGYVGYAEQPPIAFGMYVDNMESLQITVPMEGNADITAITGTTNSRIFYIQVPLQTMNLSAGTHTVYFISIFEDGYQELTHWTVNLEKEEVDLSQKQANVIVLAGQSNAYGASALTSGVKGLASADYSKIFIHYSNINCENGVWKPLYSNAGFEQFAPGVGGTVDGLCFGPEVGLAHTLATAAESKDEVWYIIKYTAAGSILDGQWLQGTYDNEGLIDDMGGHLNDLMLSYIDQSLTDIRQIHGDENIVMHSLIWMQGESDALAPDCANKYQANEAALVNAFRTKYANYAKNGNGDNIAFVSGGIAKYADIDVTLTGEKISNGWTYSDTVNNGKKANAGIEWDPVNNDISNKDGSALLKNSAWIDTSSLLVGANAGENNDVYHYSSVSMWTLGQWFGIAANYVHAVMPQ